MEKERFTAKQVYILIFAIVVAIAFMETPAGVAVWTWLFWRKFLLNVLMYGVIVEFVMVILGRYFSKD